MDRHKRNLHLQALSRHTVNRAFGWRNTYLQSMASNALGEGDAKADFHKASVPVNR